MYPTDSVSLAWSSSGYRVYSCFFEDGYFWSVVYECEFAKWMSQTVGKMAAGSGQLAAKPGTFKVVAVWVHCVHIAEMEDCARSWLTCNCDFFDPRYEIVHARRR